MSEIWREIEGYEGLYQVSNEGRVRSLGNDKTRKTKFLKPYDNGWGYLFVVLYKDGKMKKFFIHRLVAQAFLPNIFNLNEVNHINEDKTNNCVDNLEWCSHKYNTNYGTRNERVSEKLSKPLFQFTKTGEFIRDWSSVIEVERVLGYRRGSISSCCSGRYKSAYGYIWKYKE